MRLDLRPESPLDDLGLRHIFDLYGVLAPVMTPVEANECELWELAAVLKIEPGIVADSGLDDRIAQEATPDQLAARVAKAQIKPRRSSKDPPNLTEPPALAPVPPDETTDITGQVMRQMGITTN